MVYLQDFWYFSVTNVQSSEYKRRERIRVYTTKEKMITAMSIKYETIKSETIHTENADLTTTFTTERDPFDEPLEDNLIMNAPLFAEARNSVTVDGIEYSFLKPPYMNFDDQLRSKRKLREAYTQHEFLLLYGYSGCGKTTVLTQFHERFPDYIHLITDFTSLSPANLIVKMNLSASR